MEWFGSAAGLSAAATWAVSSVLFSRVPISAAAMASFKNILAAVLMGLLLFATKRQAGLPFTEASSDAWQLLGWSGVVGLVIVLGVWLMLASFKYCPAGIAATLTSTSPLFVIPIVWLWLGYRISSAAIIGAIVAFCGVCWLVLSPIGVL